MSRATPEVNSHNYSLQCLPEEDDRPLEESVVSFYEPSSDEESDEESEEDEATELTDDKYIVFGSKLTELFRDVSACSIK